MTGPPAFESPRPGTGVTGIVLAGGRSSRFGSDKLVVELDGRTLLARAVEAVEAVASEILVVCSPAGERDLPSSRVPVRRVDDPEAYGGPLVGLRAGLEAAVEPLVLVIGGDMPAVQPEVLHLLLGTLMSGDSAIGAAVLASGGRLVPLPAALRTVAARDDVARLVDDGERRLRTLFERLPTHVLDEGDWRPFDPDGQTLRDVDRPEDLPLVPRSRSTAAELPEK